MQPSNITKNNEVSLVETRKEGNAIIIEFGQGESNLENQAMTEKMEQIVELLTLTREETQEEILGVKKAIESKYITPEQLNALESLVDKKASKFVDKKKGIQLSIDVLLNYDAEGLAEFQKLVNDEVGKTKSKIWVDLHKKCLEQKGTTAKNRILATQVEQAFDYVRSWGGFSV